MPTVKYKHFQYSRDKFYYDKISEPVHCILNDPNNIEIKSQAQIHENHFLRLLSDSIRIDEHYFIKNIIKQLNRHLNSKFAIKVFLFQSEVNKAYCTPRYFNNGKSELIVLVSQHFFNDLGEFEKLSVLSHELAHMVYNQTFVPTAVLLAKQNSNKIIQIKSDLLKWSICNEITADIFSLIASDFNDVIVCRSLLKFHTGLKDVHGDDLIKMAIKQYNDIVKKDNYFRELSSHPLMPLRIKIIDEMAHHDLFKYYGKNISKENLEKLQKDFNKKIDSLVEKIYPEIVHEQTEIPDLELKMMLAVALSDNVLTQDEIDYILERGGDIILSKKINLKNFLNSNYSINEVQKIKEELIEEAVNDAFKLKLKEADIISIIKELLIIANLDKIELSELYTIHKFASKIINISKEDILNIAFKMNS
jgi:hypothetical protein